MMEAVRNSETSVNFNVTTRRYIPKDSKLQKFNCSFNYHFKQLSHLHDDVVRWSVNFIAKDGETLKE
jgi:hypothetical protein